MKSGRRYFWFKTICLRVKVAQISVVVIILLLLSEMYKIAEVSIERMQSEPYAGILPDLGFDLRKLTQKRFLSMTSLSSAESGSYIVDKEWNTTLCSLKNRVKFVSEMCRNAGRTPVEHFDEIEDDELPNNLLVDDRHGILYCDLTHADRTIWINLLALSTTGPDQRNKRSWIPKLSDSYLRRYGLRRLHTYNDTEKRTKLKSYIKFMVVRHPYDRLLSAWKEQFLNQGTRYRKELAPTIIKRYRQGSIVDDLVRFEEFIKHVVQEGSLSDPEWLTYAVCKPCFIQYDYISRTETSNLDDKLMRLLLGLDLLEWHPNKVLVPDGHHRTRKILTQYSNVSKKDMERLNDLYGADMRLFGYNFDPDKHIAACEFEGKKCC